MEIKDLNGLSLVTKKKEVKGLMARNEASATFQLSLSEEEATQLVESKNQTLRKYKRLELGESILGKLVDAFQDSQYLSQGNYLETLIDLQDLFYQYKNECMDLVSDDELIEFMREQFEEICYGDLDYLGGTCLERFKEAVKAGWRNNEERRKERYDELTTEKRWDKDVYLDVLKELFW
ncbi:DUF6323 family protein [Ohessyouella blattaphilus]|uniref:DUF6323 family protein n=1 Tax=Ohessyouella blattaphilus TaxID=2949333 RepID=A0ABT1EIB4_9FIRM|nr:DUF6323 family protein [Ohessyouella blattaphilus]MCP1110445.1 DUF6323 family protein [Ohessyouella blattaphilus]MCR8563839.1 DUF6323 family protein [Ohessyouella blattaphilus]